MINIEYKVIGDNNYLSEDIVSEILKNRSVSEEIFDYSKNSLPSPFVFSNMDAAADCIIKHIDKKSKVVIVEDSDPDGLTSTAMLHNYLKDHCPEMDIQIVIHEKRVHGIFMDELEPYLEGASLVIIPDAGSEDVDQRIELVQRGLDVLVVDHHEPNEGINATDPQAGIIVNNNIDGIYTSLSGAGMCYMLMKAIDEKMWTNYADNYIDLAMLGCVSDMMDISTDYMQHIVQEGMSNIRNKGLDAMVSAQSFSIGDKIDPVSISFYITPIINSVYRLGSMEDKRNLTNSFCNLDDTIYIYTPKRGKNKGEDIEETIYQKSARECISLNGKRQRLGKKAVKEAKIYEDCAINFVEIDSEYGSKGLSRIVANNLARKEMKPTVVYYRNESGDLRGSMSSGDVIDKFKDRLNETPVFKFVKGHQAASGLQVKEDMLPTAVTEFNKKFGDLTFDKIYEIDFDIPYKDFVEHGYDIGKDICEYDYMYGKGIEAPRILISNIKIPISQVELIGAKKSTIKFNFADGLSAIMFNSNEEFYTQMVDWKDFVDLNIVGRFSKNEYKDNVSFQIMIDDLEVFNLEESVENDIDEDDDWG